MQVASYAATIVVLTTSRLHCLLQVNTDSHRAVRTDTENTLSITDNSRARPLWLTPGVLTLATGFKLAIASHLK